mmetsp:Transcript_23689/g.34988  ORF Transcript_23689/g.34988 Transcript_23689/m.34988 type:complete len:297 (+) Transcript_23689:148-1038(+)
MISHYTLLHLLLQSFLLSNAFIPNHHASSQVARKAANSICAFESDDFALPTGDWPYTDEDMGRLDKSDDSSFYKEPRFVKHIDDRAIEALTNFYRDEFSSLKNDDATALDLCSSWISHFPEDTMDRFSKVVGVGMNEEELKANPQLTEYVVQDLNTNPSLEHFDDNSFDVICNVVSVDYLTKPREIFQEMHRILKPGGVALMSFSDRCFATKAVAMWLQADEIGRLTIVASYFHYTAEWSMIEALDIIPPKLESPERPTLGDIFQSPAKGFAWMTTVAAVQKTNAGDPMFVVKAVK